MFSRPRLTLLAVLAAVLLLARCGSEPASADYVARVGDQYLTQAEVSRALEYVPPGRDSTEARAQVIEQWVRGALLYAEAERRTLRADSAVRHQLRQSERSVLVSAVVDRLRSRVPPPTPAEMEAYFEQNREQLRLREPFVRVRYLATDSAAAATAARAALVNAARAGTADSVWASIAHRHGAEAALLGESYYPEQRLLSALPAAQTLLENLPPGTVAPAFEARGRHHVLQLVDRLPAGTPPELAWVEGEVRRRLLMQRRKQMIERQVQRLRNEAASRGTLEIR